MERLTIDEIIEHCDRKTEMYEKACDVKYLETTVMNNPIKEYWEHKQVAEYLRKLKAYENLEEQGRLVKLPCKVGDTLYRLVPNLYREYVEIKIAQCVINENEIYFITNKGASWSADKIGKTVFLTKSEAEAKLKELRCNND